MMNRFRREPPTLHPSYLAGFHQRLPNFFRIGSSKLRKFHVGEA